MRSDELNDSSMEIKGPVPFWFINSPITREEIARELDMMQRQGIREVIVHPRYGLNVEYPGDGWFEVLGWCLEEARTRGMCIWIYDELNWPSGTAGMTVQARNPEFSSQYLAVSVRDEEAGPPAITPAGMLIAARIQGGRVTKTSWIRDQEALDNLGADWTFFECETKRDRFYIDTLNSAAVDAFKSVTHEEYYRRFGSEFGRTIRAIFTDEPSIYWVSVGYDDWNLPYTDSLFATFTERHGYLAQPMIPYLFYPGREAAAFRADFWEHVSSLFNKNYHENLATWCRQHAVIYTGHNNHEEPIRYQIRFQGNMFGSMSAMDIPGVDHLGKATLGNPWISIIGHKIASSSAHHEDKARVMSESFGATGWDTTFLDLKKIADWQFSLGVNLLVPHAMFHSIAGPRKRESPPSFFHQSPHWQDFDAFSAYIDRLTEALTGGKHVCRILILYPLAAFWSAYQPDRHAQEMDYLENFLNSLCLELMNFHLDFDFVDFATLENAWIQSGRICLSKESYDVLIVPPCHHLRWREQQKLLEIAEKGVVTYALYRSTEPDAANRPQQAKITFIPTEELVPMVVQLSGLLEQDIHLSGRGNEDVTLLRRKKDGKEICFMVNRADSHRRVMLNLPGRPQITAISPEDGRSVPLPSHGRGGVTEAIISLGAYESIIVTAGPEAPGPVEAHAPDPAIRKVEIPGLRVSVPYNVGEVFNFSFTGKDGVANRTDVRENQVHIPVNWDPNPPDYTIWAGEYTAELDIDVDPAGLRLVLDGEYADHELYVNGRRANLRKAQPHLIDWGDVEPDETDLLVKGANQFRVITKTRLSEPLRVVGQFIVNLEDETVRLTPGEYEEHKFELEKVFPFFSGAVAYETEIELDALPGKLYLNLHDVRDAAVVYFNDDLAGKRLWAPYRFDVTDFARLGVNKIKIEVRNNLANLLSGRPRPFGLREMPALEVEE